MTKEEQLFKLLNGYVVSPDGEDEYSLHPAPSDTWEDLVNRANSEGIDVYGPGEFTAGNVYSGFYTVGRVVIDDGVQRWFVNDNGGKEEL